MSDPDVWAAFESTPAPIEPVANRDNSLQGFQRRLLEECGEKLEQTRKDLKEVTKEAQTFARDLILATQLLDRAYAIFAQISCGYEPHGYGDLMVDIDDFRESLNG